MKSGKLIMMDRQVDISAPYKQKTDDFSPCNAKLFCGGHTTLSNPILST
jgi:hypothetical protein